MACFGFMVYHTIIGYLMLNILYTYILDIYDLVWFGVVWCGLVLWHNTNGDYLMPNSPYTYISNMVCFGFMPYQRLYVI